MTKLTVIIPIYNALNDVKLCLKSLKKYFNFNIGEIIIINDSSNEETSNYLKNFCTNNIKFQLIENESNLGFVQTCNKGMQMANGEIIVLLNSDTVIPKNFSEKIIKCFQSDKKIGIASPIASYSNEYFIPCNSFSEVEKINKLLVKKHKCEYPLILMAEGFCYCIRKKVIEQQGYFDEIWGKGYHEESDYSLKAINNGWKNVLIDNLYVFHRRNASFGEKRTIQIEKNNQEFYKRWKDFMAEYKITNHLQNPVFNIEKEIFPKGNPVKSDIQLSCLEKIFSIKNTKDKQHKVLNILGIKFKFFKYFNSDKNMLVHFHLYYYDQLDYFISKMKNITGCKWDLYVTIVEENKEQLKKLKKFKPDVHIIKVYNKGYDILPFLQVIRTVNITKYDYVLKIHTKNYRTTSQVLENVLVKGFSWRDELVNSLLYSKKVFNQNLVYLNDSNIGLICSKTFLFPLRNRIEDTILLDKLKKMLEIKNNYSHFVAGTMFMIKANILKNLISVDFDEEDFNSELFTCNSGSFIHAIERIFTVLTDYYNFKILGLPLQCNEIKEQKSKVSFLKYIFSIYNEISCGERQYKVIYLLGIKFSFRNKRKEKRMELEQEKQFIKDNLNSLINQNNELKKQQENLQKQNNELKNELKTQQEIFKKQSDELKSELKTQQEIFKKQNDELKNELKTQQEIFKKQNDELKNELKTQQEIFKKQNDKTKTELSYIKEWQTNFRRAIPGKFPMRLTDNEINLLVKYFKISNKYLEFGSGGSTFLALLNSDLKIYSVESDYNWLEYLRTYKFINNAEINNKLSFKYIDIGKTRDWGMPIDDSKKKNYPNYSLGIFNGFSSKDIDLVFIDGRFRVACAIASILNCSQNTHIAIHDYTIREHYHIVEEFLDIVEQQDTLVVFKIKPNISIDRLKKIYEEYKFIKE